MFSGRNIPRKSATGAFTKGADEIVKNTEAKTKAMKAAKDSAAAQHGRFVQMAKEVGASTHTQDFEAAFNMVAGNKGEKKT